MKLQVTNPYWKKIKEDSRLKKKLSDKSQILSAVRTFFGKEGFLEMDTPTLVLSPDTNPFNEVMEVKFKTGEKFFLTPSPEFFLKKFLVSGFKNIYQITKAYRDGEEKDPVHLREFTILEWYRNEADYFDLMTDCENLVNFIWERLLEKCQMSNVKCQNQNVKLKTFLNYQGLQINLSPPWSKISCKEAFGKYANINLDEFLDIQKARKICQGKGYQVTLKNTWEELYHQIFLNEVEPFLPKEQPLILYDYPAPLAALSKIKENDPRYAERFEFYIGGLELGNGYSELTDFSEQEKRLKKEIKIRMAKKMKTFNYDRDFVEALKEGMSKTAGIAVGLDRLIMLFTDSADIHEVTPFAV